MNCKGLKDPKKLNLCHFLFSVNNYDILLLQETHIENNYNANRVARKFDCLGYWSYGTNRSCGVGILVKKVSNLKVNAYQRDEDGRYISIDLTYFDIPFKIINIYAPNNSLDRKNFFRNIQNYNMGNSHIIYGGDFNFVENVTLDKIGGNASTGATTRIDFDKIKEDYDLIDIYRKLHPRKKEFTFSGQGVQSRLDRFYVSRDLSDSVRQIEIVPCTFSDHHFLVMTIENEVLTLPKGPGYWKCNIKILEDEEFKKDLKKVWERLCENGEKDVVWWENCKTTFKELIIEHSRKKAKENRIEEKETLRLIKFFEMLENEQPGHYADILQFYKLKIESIYGERLQGSVIRSKVQEIQEEEKPSRFFLRKENTNAKDKHIKLLERDGQVFDTRDTILGECRRFYEELFKYEPVNNNFRDEFFQGLPSLPEDLKLQCEGLITLEEVEEALGKMQGGKTPGLDGLPKEFYVKFFHLIGKDLTDLYNRLFDEGLLTISQRTGLITLLCKDENRRSNLKFWRPITLLSVDYKILSKVLSIRLSRCLDFLVNEDQVCAVPGRTIFDSLYNINAVMNYANDNNISYGCLSLDQSKAFDRVSHEYLFTLLERYGFGKDFLKWIGLLYNQIESKIIVNGFVSEAFSIGRSVRQGCALSPLLYVLYITPFARKILSSPLIKGPSVPGNPGELKLIQYADDTTIIFKNDQAVKETLSLAERFGTISGAKLNKEKCKGMWFGRWHQRNNNVHGIDFSHDHLKILGITFSKNLHQMKNLNWNGAIEKFGKTLQGWSFRDTTFRGRSVISSIMACSKLWHVGHIIELDERHLKKFNTLLFHYIWKGDQDRVKRDLLYKEFIDGGLKVVNIDLKLKAFRIHHIVNLLCGTGTPKWKYYAIYYVGFHLRKWNGEFARNSIPHASNICPFYTLCLRDFKKFTTTFPNGKLEELSVKKIYRKLLSQTETVSAVSIMPVNKYIDFSEVWPNIHNDFSGPKLRDIAWRIAHNILPVNAKLYSQGSCRTRICPLCGIGVETIEHLLLQCNTTINIRQVVENLGMEITKRPFFLTRNIALFNILKGSGHQKNILILILNIFKETIWVARNRTKFDRASVSPIDILNDFLSALHFRLVVDQKRLTYETVERTWAINEALCRKVGKKFVFNL